MASGLREQKKSEPVRSVIQFLDNILAVGFEDRWRVLDVIKKNRAAMGSFGIPLPGKFIEAGCTSPNPSLKKSNPTLNDSQCCFE